jgi:hypothetical protein
MLLILINRAKGEGQILGVIPNLVDECLSILQYVDDTILFMDHNLEQAKNMKLPFSKKDPHSSGVGLGKILQLKKRKWLFKLINEEGLWQTILRIKYLTKTNYWEGR